jgi:ketosteroid isomerase-like protein
MLPLALARGQPARAQVPPDPVDLWQQWLAAVNGGDIASALASLTDDAVYILSANVEEHTHCAQGCRGLAAIRAELERQVQAGFESRVDPTSIRATGDGVTGVVESSDARWREYSYVGAPYPFRYPMEVQVRGDKIAALCWRTCATGAVMPQPSPRPSLAQAAPAPTVVTAPATPVEDYPVGRNPTRLLLAGLGLGLLLLVGLAAADAVRRLRGAR